MLARAAHFSRSLLLLTVLAYAACSDPTAPKIFIPSLTIVSGATASDTIGAFLSVPLAVIVHDSTGNPPFHAPITFRVLPIAGSDSAPALVSPTTYVYGPGPQTAMAEWTDSSGYAAVTVRLGGVADQIRIAIDGVESNAVPPSGPNGKVVPVHDTITYTVLPGAAVSLDVQPSDTSLYVGRDYQLRVRSLDRAGNSRPDQISLTGGDSVLARDGGVGVIGRTFGRDFTDVSTPTHRTRVWVSVVPVGTIAITIGLYAPNYGMGVVNLDGSGSRLVFGPDRLSTVNSPRWSPDGKSIAADYGRIYLIDAATGIGRIATGDVAGQPDWGPSFSPDGRWIYYSKGPYGSDQYTLWRVLVDVGSTPEQLPLPMQNTPFQPDVSPDGLHVVYLGGDGYLHELTLADGSVRTITAAHGPVNTPRYSHDGSTLAYLWSTAFNDFDPAAGVYTIPVQGSTAQRITPQVSSDSFMWTYGGNTWSPDDEWIVTTTVYQMWVVNVKTGLMLPLPWASDYSSPDWKPR
jgi:Tol biopolymer transport system component